MPVPDIHLEFREGSKQCKQSEYVKVTSLNIKIFTFLNGHIVFLRVVMFQKILDTGFDKQYSMKYFKEYYLSKNAYGIHLLEFCNEIENRNNNACYQFLFVNLNNENSQLWHFV